MTMTNQPTPAAILGVGRDERQPPLHSPLVAYLSPTNGAAQAKGCYLP